MAVIFGKTTARRSRKPGSNPRIQMRMKWIEEKIAPIIRVSPSRSTDRKTDNEDRAIEERDGEELLQPPSNRIVGASKSRVEDTTRGPDASSHFLYHESRVSQATPEKERSDRKEIGRAHV